MIQNYKAMELGFIVYLNQLKRKQKRAQKQEAVAIRQTADDARSANKAELVQKY
jgi:hypothetical protein